MERLITLRRIGSNLRSIYRRTKHYWRNYGSLGLLRRLLQPAASSRVLRTILLRQPAQDATNRAVDRLWGGYSRRASEELERIITAPSMPDRERAAAAWELARWHAFQGEPTLALHHLRLIPSLDQPGRLAKRKLLLEVLTLLDLGERVEAEALAIGALRQAPDDLDYRLMASNALIEEDSALDPGDSNDARRLALINHPYEQKGLLPIRKIDAGAPLTLDNITAAPLRLHEGLAGPKVSVIMPAYNASATIGYALRSLQEQTWRDLEIIVVDDASSDETVAVASRAAVGDDRVKVVGLKRNRGTYVASNEGLERVTGEYVTTHGADDWSHPQKIESQVSEPLDGDFVASKSFLVRTSLNLRFNGSWRPKETLLEENLSSFVLSTARLKGLGGWDPVRTAADGELTRRLAAKLGAPSTRIVHKDVPLSFALDQETSLTRNPETHVRSLFYGTINAYQHAYRRWHAAAKRRGDLRIDPDPGAPREFPAPAPMLSEPVAPRPYDVTLIGDFGVVDEAFNLAYKYLTASLEVGLRVAIFDWPRYESDPRDVDRRIAALIDEFKIEQLMPEQTLETGRLIVYSPAILQHRLDRVPQIAARSIHVVVDQVAEAGCGEPYDPDAVRRNLEALFGSEGKWCPASPAVREQMAADPRYPEPAELIMGPEGR